MKSVVLRSWLPRLRNGCRARGALIGIAAPQGCNQTWDYAEVAKGKEGDGEGRRDGGEGKNNPNHLHSPSRLLLSGQLFCNWSSVVPARSTHSHCSLCPTAREVLALVDDVFVLHCVCHK